MFSSVVPIQHVVFPTQAELAPLYLRAEAADGGRRVLAADQLPRWERRSVMDTLFNHLPESYWRHHTEVTDFVFSARVDGCGRIELWRRGPDGHGTLATIHAFDHAEPTPLSLLIDATAAPAGVLFVRVVAGSRPVRLDSGLWAARDVIPARTRLVAGYCTFNREPRLLDNVRAILAEPAAVSALKALVVVDQGRSPTMGEALDEISPHWPVRLIQQDNFGGSGGFARVILEALRIEGATHVLLLDDDARMEPESIFRAAAFLSLSKNKALGGQMLDLATPLRVYEQGASLDPATLRVTRGNGDLVPVGPDGVTAFATVQPCQWNGWWFFAAPLSAVRDNGLPLPLFLRCDDVEYGIRLLGQGIETVGMPGIAVWHEPFYLNIGGWQGYFDIRNVLAAASIHHGLTPLLALRHMVGLVLGALLTYDYYSAWLYCQGVADWLAGPDSLEAPPQRRLDELRRMAVRFREVDLDVERVDLDHRPNIASPPGGRAIWWPLILRMGRTVMERDRSPVAASVPGLPATMANWWVLAHYHDVAIEPILPGGRWKRLHRSPRLFRAMFARMTILAFRVALGGRAAAKRWHRHAPELSSITRWRQRLEADAVTSNRGTLALAPQAGVGFSQGGA